MFDRDFHKNDRHFQDILQRCILPLNDVLLGELRYSLNFFNRLNLDSKRTEVILHKHGIRSVIRDMKSGTSAVVIPFSQYPQVLKISGDHDMHAEDVHVDSREIANIPEIQKPLKVLHENNPRVEVYYEVEPAAGVTDKHIEALQVSLFKKGYLFYDATPRNVALLSDGTPIIIDQGAVFPIHAANKIAPSRRNISIEDSMLRNSGRDIAALRKLADDPHYIIPYNFLDAQKQHVQKQGLEFGHIKDVITEDDAKNLENLFTGKGERPEQSETVRVITENGLDRNLLLKLFKAAAELSEDNMLWKDAIQKLTAAEPLRR